MLIVAVLAAGCTSDPESGATPTPASIAEAASPASPSPTATLDAVTSLAVKRPSTADAPAPSYVVPIVAFGSSADVVRAIVDADKALKAGTPSAAFTAAARSQQSAFRQLAVTPAWLDSVVAGVPASLRQSLRANVTAAAELRALTKPRPDLPPWRIANPRPAAELLGFYREAQAATGIDWTYLAAINLVETRMGRIRGLSTAGAQGPMQFLPSTWAEPGIGKGDIDDPHDSIQAAARYLVRRGGPSDMARALRAYNNSRRYVTAVTAYAQEMQRDPDRYLAYHQWGVLYRWTRGEVMLREGYTAPGR